MKWMDAPWVWGVSGIGIHGIVQHAPSLAAQGFALACAFIAGVALYHTVKHTG